MVLALLFTRSSKRLSYYRAVFVLFLFCLVSILFVSKLSNTIIEKKKIKKLNEGQFLHVKSEIYDNQFHVPSFPFFYCSPPPIRLLKSIPHQHLIPLQLGTEESQKQETISFMAN